MCCVRASIHAGSSYAQYGGLHTAGSVLSREGASALYGELPLSASLTYWSCLPLKGLLCMSIALVTCLVVTVRWIMPRGFW